MPILSIILSLCLAGASPAADPGTAAGSAAEETIAKLVDALDDPDEEVRRNLSIALSRLSPECVPRLTLTLRDHSANRRAGAALALALIGPPAKTSLPDLLNALSDESPDVRRQVSFAISRVVTGGRPVAPATGRVVRGGR